MAYDHAGDDLRSASANARLSEQVSAFLGAVYGWMCAGLAITAITVWFVGSSIQLATSIAANRPLFCISTGESWVCEPS